MAKKQKLILIVLAIMDVLVIGGMAFVIWSSNRPVTLIQASLSPCETAIQQAMQPDYNASFSISADNPGDLTILLSSRPMPVNLDSEQSLWQILDILASVIPQRCPGIETIQVNITTHDPTSYTFVVMADDLSAWARQDIDNDIFAARILYREITNTEN